MKHLTSEMKQQQLEWRRSQVLELASQGYSKREIAKQLQIDLTAVNRDIQFLRHQAQDNLQKHFQEAVPEEYQMARIGMNQVLKMAWSIVNKDIDNRTKLQALALINDCNKYKMDLASGGAIYNEALKFVTQKKEQLDTLQKIDERIEAIEEETTTNGVF